MWVKIMSLINNFFTDSLPFGTQKPPYWKIIVVNNLIEHISWEDNGNISQELFAVCRTQNSIAVLKRVGPMDRILN